jgi:pimeloyl-ACP methyl ester carboxylesterase
MQEFRFEKRGLSYRTNGFDVGRRTIVFIHGLTGSCSAWYDYEARFEQAYNIISVDIRGHGKSAKYKPLEEYTIPRFADDISLLLEDIRIETFILVAHSFGTLIALELALRHARGVEALFLLAPAYDVRNIRSKATIPILKVAAALLRLYPFLAPIRGRTDYSKYKQTGDFNFWRGRADICNTSVRVHVFCLLQIYLYDQANKWDRLAAPITVIHGRKDGIIPVRQAEHMKASLPAIKLIVLDRADHILILNEAPIVAAAITKFLGALN